MCKSRLLYLTLIDVFKRKNGGTAHWCTSLRLRWNEFAAWDPGSWMCQSRSHSRGLPDGRTVEYWRWKNQLMWNSSARTDVKLCHQKHPWTSLWETASVRTFISPQSLKKKKKKREKIVQSWLRDTLQLRPVDVSASLWKKDQQAQTEEFAHVDKSEIGNLEKHSKVKQTAELYPSRAEVFILQKKKVCFQAIWTVAQYTLVLTWISK